MHLEAGVHRGAALREPRVAAPREATLAALDREALDRRGPAASERRTMRGRPSERKPHQALATAVRSGAHTSLGR